MPDPSLLLIPLVIFFAAFTQSLAGFGLALVSMPLLVGMIGIRIAAPLVALVGITSQTILLLHYRTALKPRAITRLAVGSVIGIPLGVVALRQVDDALVTRFLGVVIVGYASYALLAPRLPVIERDGWGYAFGLVGGLLTGAYNTGGPPLVIYGNCRNWQPAEFKGNLQALVLIHSVTVLIAHAASGNYTPSVLASFLLAVPAILLGVFAGMVLDAYINPSAFRRVVLIPLLLVGTNLAM